MAKRRKKLAPVEVAFIRRALPYLKRHMRVPRHLLAAVAKSSPRIKLSASDIKRIEKLLAVSAVSVRASGTRIVIRKTRGPGRPKGGGKPGRRRGPGRPPKKSA